MSGKIKFCAFFVLVVTAIAAQPANYADFWHAAGYPDRMVPAMANLRSAEQLSEEFRPFSTSRDFFERGRLFYARGLYRQALAFFEKAKDIGDESHYFIGMCYFVVGESDSAKLYLSKIESAKLRPLASAALAKIAGTAPQAIMDYNYLRNYFPTTEKEPEMPNPTGGYTLQFGAFADSVKAYKLIEKLTDIGLEPYISETDVNGAKLLRVRAENFDTRDEAEEAGSALGDQFIYMVVPRE